jgi:hypothetical protein
MFRIALHSSHLALDLHDQIRKLDLAVPGGKEEKLATQNNDFNLLIKQ